MSRSALSDELCRFLEEPAWITLATRDRALRTEIATVTGLSAVPGAETFTVYLADAIAGPTRTNLAEHPELAVAIAEPLSCRSYQLKGRATAVRAATEAERWIVERHRGQTFALLAGINILPSTARRVAAWPATAIEVALRDVYSQTPGPRAGERVQGGAA